MPQPQEVNTISQPVPFSKRLPRDKELSLSCPDFKSLIIGTDSSEIINDSVNQLQRPFSYPSTCEYAELADRVYYEKKKGGELKQGGKQNQTLLEEWKLLTTGCNGNVKNGYFGSAYWSASKQQVVIAHRGIVCSVGAFLTSLNGIVKNQHSSQLNSAVTFAYEVAKVIQEINRGNHGLNIQLSFTGHSVGGWLAQITTFTAKYLRLDEALDHFLQDKDFRTNGLHAHTVVFDSPGCQKKLSSLQNEFGVYYGPNALSSKNLDITSYLSAPNLVNTCNYHVGTLYRVSIDISEANYLNIPLNYTWVMHGMQKIKEAVSDSEQRSKIRKVSIWPVLGKRSPSGQTRLLKLSASKLLSYGFEALEHCKILHHIPVLLVPMVSPLLPLHWIHAGHQLHKHSKEYRKVFEILNAFNNFDASPEELLDSMGYIKIRYLTESINHEDNKSSIKNVFTDEEWQFLLRYSILSAQPSSESTCKEVFSRIFNNDQDEGDKAVNILNRFKIDNEMLVVNEGKPEEFIAYVKHMLHLFPGLYKDEQLNPFNVYYQSESSFYIQSSIIGFFKENVLQPVSNENSIAEEAGSSEVTAQINASHHFKTDIINLDTFLTKQNSKILHIIYPDSLIAVNVIYDIYQGGLKSKGYDFFSLKNISKFQGTQFYEFLTAIKDSYLLVIECELSNGKLCEREQKFLERLFDILLDENLKVKVILVSQANSLTDFLSQETSQQLVNRYVEKKLYIKFDDLTESAKDKLLTREIIFQGEEIALNELITKQDNKIVDPETLVTLIKNEKIEIGKPVPTLDEVGDYYVARKLSHKVKINKNALSDSGDMFFISNVRNQNELSAFVASEYIEKFSDIKNNIAKNRKNNEIKFIRCDNNQTAEEDFKWLCGQYSKKTIHWLEKTASGLIWHQSQGGVSLLRKHLDQSANGLIIKDEEIITGNGDNKPIIIAAEPGMGKSTVLTYLANQEKEKESLKWVVRVDLKKCAGKLNRKLFDTDNIINFLYGINGTENLLSQALLDSFVKKGQGKLVLLLDGFDEIEENQQDKVIELIKGINNTKIEKVMVSTRLHERERLEDELSVFAYTFKPFDSAEQKKFLEGFWKRKLEINAEDEKKEGILKDYIKKLLDALPDTIKDAAKGFMGIPLQTKMIAEIYQSDVEGLLKGGVMDLESIKNLEILKLYERFVQCKYELYLEKESGGAVLFGKDKQESLTLSYTYWHRHLAIWQLFPNMNKEMAALLRSEYLLVLNKLDVLKSIGVFQSIDSEDGFVHRSYAEYFTAGLLNDMLQRNVSKETALLFLSEEIFKPKHEVIRIFLDNYLTNRKTVYEENLDAMNSQLKDSPYFIPDKWLIKVFYDTTAEGKLSDSALPDLFKKLLDELETFPISAENINNSVRTIKGRINGLSEAAAYNKRIRYEAMGGKLAVVKSLFKYAKKDMIDVNDTDNMGRTALHYAAQKGSEDIVSTLLEKGFKIDVQDDLGKNALHYAARYNSQNKQTIECLLEHVPEERIKAIINQKDEQGFTPLYYAVKQGYWHLVSALIEKGANFDGLLNEGELLFHYIFENKPEKLQLSKVKDINQYRDNQGNGLLHIAAQRGYLESVKSLLENGIDVQIRNKRGERSINCAAQNGHWEVVTLLLTNSFLLDNKPNKADFNDLNNNQKDLLIEYSKENKVLFNYYVEHADWDMVKLFLIKKPALLNEFNDLKAGLLFAHVVKGAHWNIVNIFIESANGQDYFNALEASQKRNYLNYLISVGADQLETIKAFLTEGRNIEGLEINGKDDEGKAFLHRATESQQLEIVKYLTEDKQAYVYVKDQEGHTPLDYAALIKAWRNVDIVDHLLDKEAGDKLPCKLHYAIENDYKKEVVKALLIAKDAVNAIDNKGRTPLHLAVLCGRREIVEVLLKTNGIEVNAKDNHGKTPLHLAVLRGRSEIVEVLLMATGIEINAKDNHEWTPLHLAAVYNGHKDILELLTKSGAEVNAEGEDKRTPLHLASAYNAHKEVVEALLMVEGIDIEAKDNEGMTSLQWAAKNGHQYALKVLIDNGAIVNTEEKDGLTLLHLAAKNGHKEVVEELLAVKDVKGIDVEAKDNEGMTSLQWAAKNGHLEMVKYLVAQGANVKSKDKFDRTPLYCAAKNIQGNLNVEVVKYLLEKEACCALPYKLHYAAKQGYKEVIDALLMEEGVNVDTKNDLEETPLHVAAQEGRLEMVKYLVEKRHADVRARDQNGHTPLYYAAKNTQGNVNIEVVKYLLEKEARCELPYKLHYAAEQGYKEVIEALLTEKGANVDARNDRGETPLHQAACYGHLAVVELLFKNKAAFDAKDRRGKIPLHEAASHGHLAVVELLIKNKAAVHAKNIAVHFIKTIGAPTPLHSAASVAQLAEGLLFMNKATVDAKDNDKNTPLYLAAAYGHQAVVELLIRNGANVNAEGQEKSAPLHVAAVRGHGAVAALLIKNRANVNAEMKDKRTPLHWAAEKGHVAVAKVLRDRGVNQAREAEVNAKDDAGYTPLHLAAENGHFEMVKYLVEQGADVKSKNKDGKTPSDVTFFKREQKRDDEPQNQPHSTQQPHYSGGKS